MTQVLALPVNVADALSVARAHLPALEAEVLLAFAMEKPRAWLKAHGEAALEPAIAQRFVGAVEARASGVPVAYITGEREFYGLPFAVTPAVLIPRPETELLVEYVLATLKEAPRANVLDLGTGSGCVAIAIKHTCLEAHVSAIDSSFGALRVAGRNVERLLGDEAAIELLRGSWFGPVYGRVFDVIVSNPPYVAQDDPHLAQGDVRFEPRTATAAGEQGLDALELIIASAPSYLVPGGLLAVEHGFDQAEAVRELFAYAGFQGVGSRPDLAGIERVTSGHLPAA